LDGESQKEVRLMTAPPTSDHEIQTQVLAAYEFEYRDLADNWKSLDAKAQGTVGIAGLFIGGALALANRLTVNSSATLRGALGFGVILLLVCVVCSLTVLKIREVSAPPDGDSASDLANGLLDLPRDSRYERFLPYLNDRVKAWRISNQAVADANDSKATWLWRAQRLLGGAIFTFGVLVGLQLAGVL
jgi:hypothetical protein